MLGQSEVKYMLPILAAAAAVATAATEAFGAGATLAVTVHKLKKDN